MKPNKKPRLTVEQLEDRWVPTTVKVLGDYLIISNPTLGANNVATITVQETGVGLAVATGSSTIHVGNVGNIIYTGSLGKDDFTFDANGNNYSGNLILSTGNGNDTVNISNSAGALGRIGGNVTLISGAGLDDINIAATATSTGALTIAGNVEVVHSIGASSVSLGNTTAPTTINGNVQVTGPFSAVTLSPGSDTYAGNLSINNTLAAGSDTIAIGSATSNILVGGSLSINGSNLGSASTTLTLDGGTGIGLTVNGTTSLNLGNGSSNFAANDSITFASGFTLNAGSGNDSVTVSAATSFYGNAAVTLGDGDNSIAGLGNAFTALGNFTLSAGNGNNAIGSATIGGNINGNLFLMFGNGNNGDSSDSGATGVGADTLTVGGSVGGTVYFRSGNGDNQLNIGDNSTNPANNNNYNLNILFGNGNDTLGVDNGTGIYNGYVNGGGGTNIFNPISGTPTPVYQQYNFF